MITLTPLAKQQLSRLLREKAGSTTAGLRLAVKRGGCAGWQYVMEVSEPEPGDQVLEDGEARLYIAADSTTLLEGVVLDYTLSLNDTGFKIVNPNAARSCGCGTSFEATDSEKEPEYDPSLDGTSCSD